MSRFEFLGGVIPFAFAVVFVIYVIILAIFLKSKRDKKVSPDVMQKASRTAFQRYFYGINFENVYQSPWGSGRLSMYLLFLWRVACLGFFYGNDMIAGLIHNGGSSAIYFTNWNIYLISLYYSLASIASGIGICKDSAFREHVTQHQLKNRNRETVSFWADATTMLGVTVHILFEIAGSTAFFITVIDFCALNPNFVYWNVSLHFITSMSFLVELFLNSMFVRWEHVLFTVTWGLIYLIFIWPMVATGAATKWPYFFLDTEKVTVSGWYIFLFTALIVFYYIFYGVAALKWAIVGRKLYTSETLPVSQENMQLHAKASSIAPDAELLVNTFV
jgi:hypothetical protein